MIWDHLRHFPNDALVRTAQQIAQGNVIWCSVYICSVYVQLCQALLLINALVCIDVHPEGCTCSHGKSKFGTYYLKAVDEHVAIWLKAVCSSTCMLYIQHSSLNVAWHVALQWSLQYVLCATWRICRACINFAGTQASVTCSLCQLSFLRVGGSTSVACSQGINP